MPTTIGLRSSVLHPVPVAGEGAQYEDVDGGGDGTFVVFVNGNGIIRLKRGGPCFGEQTLVAFNNEINVDWLDDKPEGEALMLLESDVSFKAGELCDISSFFSSSSDNNLRSKKEEGHGELLSGFVGRI